MPEIRRWLLNPPTKWRAGASVHADGSEEPFYFDCAGSGAQEPEIASVLATEPSYRDVAIVTKMVNGRETYWPAMFCRACTDARP